MPAKYLKKSGMAAKSGAKPKQKPKKKGKK
jgi:hypothetical protein